jgi:hypothetical protein
MDKFSIEITLDGDGVRGVRVFGKNWEHGTAAYALLERLGPAIQRLDEAAKSCVTFGRRPSRERGEIQ